jgi:hypothetical protein
VNVYFWRGLSEKNPRRPTCQDYIETKHLRMKKKHLEESGKQPPEGEGPPVRGQGARLDPWGARPVHSLEGAINRARVLEIISPPEN